MFLFARLVARSQQEAQPIAKQMHKPTKEIDTPPTTQGLNILVAFDAEHTASGTGSEGCGAAELGDASTGKVTHAWAAPPGPARQIPRASYLLESAHERMRPDRAWRKRSCPAFSPLPTACPENQREPLQLAAASGTGNREAWKNFFPCLSVEHWLWFAAQRGCRCLVHCFCPFRRAPWMPKPAPASPCCHPCLGSESLEYALETAPCLMKQR